LKVNDFAAKNELSLNPQFILTDFEQVAINASKCERKKKKNNACRANLVLGKHIRLIGAFGI